MTDNAQCLAFDTVDNAEAQAVVLRAVGWMIVQGYVGEARQDSYWDNDLSHPPGPNWQFIVDDTRRWRGLIRASDLAGPAPPGARPDEISRFLEIQPNGVTTSTGRTICSPGQNADAFEIGICPACRTEVSLGYQVEELCGLWFEGQSCTLTCSACGAASRLEDWDLQPYWAFTNAALTFWNWPSLSEAFTRNLASALGGLRIRHTVARY